MRRQRPDLRAAFGKALRKGSKIHMGGEVRLSRIGKGVGIVMSAHGLQRVARRAFAVAVIDDESGAAMAFQMRAQRFGNALRGRAGFRNRTWRRIKDVQG